MASLIDNIHAKEEIYLPRALADFPIIMIYAWTLQYWLPIEGSL